MFTGIFNTLLRMDELVFSGSWECHLVLSFQTDELSRGVITATGPRLYHGCKSSSGNQALLESMVLIGRVGSIFDEQQVC